MTTLRLLEIPEWTAKTKNKIDKTAYTMKLDYTFIGNVDHLRYFLLEDSFAVTNSGTAWGVLLRGVIQTSAGLGCGSYRS